MLIIFLYFLPQGFKPLSALKAPLIFDLCVDNACYKASPPPPPPQILLVLYPNSIFFHFMLL